MSVLETVRCFFLLIVLSWTFQPIFQCALLAAESSACISGFDEEVNLAELEVVFVSRSRYDCSADESRLADIGDLETLRLQSCLLALHYLRGPPAAQLFL